MPSDFERAVVMTSCHFSPVRLWLRVELHVSRVVRAARAVMPVKTRSHGLRVTLAWPGLTVANMSVQCAEHHWQPSPASIPNQRWRFESLSRRFPLQAAVTGVTRTVRVTATVTPASRHIPARGVIPVQPRAAAGRAARVRRTCCACREPLARSGSAAGRASCTPRVAPPGFCAY